MPETLTGRDAQARGGPLETLTGLLDPLRERDPDGILDRVPPAPETSLDTLGITGARGRQ